LISTSGRGGGVVVYLGTADSRVFFAGLIVEQAEQPIAILDGVSDSTDPRSG